jgi:hypothetical protein
MMIYGTILPLEREVELGKSVAGARKAGLKEQ